MSICPQKIHCLQTLDEKHGRIVCSLKLWLLSEEGEVPPIRSPKQLWALLKSAALPPPQLQRVENTTDGRKRKNLLKFVIIFSSHWSFHKTFFDPGTHKIDPNRIFAIVVNINHIYGKKGQLGELGSTSASLLSLKSPRLWINWLCYQNCNSV